MLNLANLRTLLSRVLDPPSLHTVALFTPEGELVCYASCPTKAKDHVRVLVGLSTEIWQETREQNIGMVDSELGHLLVMPVETPKKDEDDEPITLLALNSETSVPWSQLELKARKLAEHLEKPVAQLSGMIASVPPPPTSPRRGDRRTS
ncbi:hypothetical protein K466DRAFT_534815 [Polyporus arcularius HHB13444]|uniref:Roadblock/LAMTOR2 domain-containing protein n=1 Tax=Polyporus arcularius HHB13444 TaxID=1314778 RepID=A0A5C3Q958_9APHY|nr:hypothetical protein K466DRAFT_534815 [Polyporus arcularius HHB13444]